MKEEILQWSLVTAEAKYSVTPSESERKVSQAIDYDTDHGAQFWTAFSCISLKRFPEFTDIFVVKQGYTDSVGTVIVISFINCNCSITISTVQFSALPEE